jgi:hypothetical protein
MAVLPMPQTASERRIPLRLLAYWEKLRKERLMPAENDVNPDDIGDLWNSCFIIPVKDLHPAHYRYSYIGQDIVKAYGGDLPEMDADAPVKPQPGMLDGYRTVMQTCKPLIENGEFHNRQDQMIRYRQCLLPLGEGEDVQAILGALHFRTFPA